MKIERTCMDGRKKRRAHHIFHKFQTNESLFPRVFLTTSKFLKLIDFTAALFTAASLVVPVWMEAADVKQSHRLLEKQAAAQQKQLSVIYFRSGSKCVDGVGDLAAPECHSRLDNMFFTVGWFYAALTNPMNRPEEMYWATIKALMK